MDKRMSFVSFRSTIKDIIDSIQYGSSKDMAWLVPAPIFLLIDVDLNNKIDYSEKGGSLLRWPAEFWMDNFVSSSRAINNGGCALCMKIKSKVGKQGVSFVPFRDLDECMWPGRLGLARVWLDLQDNIGMLTAKPCWLFIVPCHFGDNKRVLGETTQKPIKGALGNRRSKGTDQRLAMARSVQVELMR